METLIAIAGLIILMNRNISSNKLDLDFIKEAEGYSPVPYPDSAGKMTIGYGHLIREHETFEIVTENQAQALLMTDAQRAVRAVNQAVSVVLTDNQYTALASFTYNIGVGAFKGSTLLYKLNQGDFVGASEQFERWKYADNKIIDGLINRRKKEKALFLA